MKTLRYVSEHSSSKFLMFIGGAVANYRRNLVSRPKFKEASNYRCK